MAHGYLREFDEGWDRDDDRERGDRDWRERGDRDWSSDRERGGWGDRDRNFMFDRNRDRDRDDDRGFFSRAGEEARSWFRDDEHDYRGDRSAWENNRDYPQRDRGRSSYGGFQGDYRGGREQGGFGGSSEWREGRRGASAHPDDHYRSWRDRQMQALDRDYEDYCREREQQFHQDFDSWRRNRQQPQGQQQGGGHNQDELLLGAARSETEGLAVGSPNEPPAMTSPEGAATVGTNNSENSKPFPRRR
jgi:hypothetical protein